MSNNNTSRRAVLTGAAGAAAVGAFSTAIAASAAIPAAGPPMASSSDIVEARRLVALMEENDRANLQAHAAKDEAAIERADIATYETDRVCGDFTDRVLAAPIQSTNDIVVRAILAGYWLRGQLGGELSPASLEQIDDVPERLYAATVIAVLALHEGAATASDNDVAA